jgi:ribulose-5-phosphate 4-epimerase/fuculose-1-phosphate aldolase
MSPQAKAREAICTVGRSLFERGYVHSSAGNISVKLDDGFLITPTDACLGELDPAELSWVSVQGELVSGQAPSKTLRLHRAIYDVKRSVSCVLHTHSTHLVALTLQGVWRADCVLPPLTPYMVMKVGEIPLIPYCLPGAPDVPELVVAHLQVKPFIRGVLLERLGPTVWGHSPRDASNVLEELEETARLWLMTGRATPVLAAHQVKDLCERFCVVWTALD